MSNEQIRSSPELWPEKITGSDNFIKSAVKNAKENEKGITQDDIRRIYRKLFNLKQFDCWISTLYIV